MRVSLYFPPLTLHEPMPSPDEQCASAQEKAKLSQPLQKGHLGFPRASAPVGSPASAALLARTSSDSIQTSLHVGTTYSPMEGISLPYPAIQGAWHAFEVPSAASCHLEPVYVSASMLFRVNACMQLHSSQFMRKLFG